MAVSDNMRVPTERHRVRTPSLPLRRLNMQFIGTPAPASPVASRRTIAGAPARAAMDGRASRGITGGPTISRSATAHPRAR